MKTQLNIDSLFRLLQKACSSTRQMHTITIDEIVTASKQLHLLKTINEKGLLVLMLSKILHEKFIIFPRELTLFVNDMFPIEKKPRVRRARNEDESRPFGRRRPKKLKDIDLNELSNQSITNPVEIVAANNRDIRQGLSKPDQNSKGSNPNSNPNSKSDPPEVDINQAIAEADLQYAINGEPTNPEQAESSQSSSTNTSVRFGQIANFKKKIDIVGDCVSFEQPNRTIRRGRNNQGTNRATTKKKVIIDEKIDLDQTGPSFTSRERLDLTTQIIQSRYKFYEENAHFRMLDQNLDKFADRFKSLIFNPKHLQKIKTLAKRQKNNTSHRIIQEPTEYHENTDFTDGQTNSFVPMSTHFQPPDSTYREHLDSNIFLGEERVTLKQLKSRVKKPKWQIFQNLLWLSQQGQVNLQQSNPQQFGDIEVIKAR